MITYEIREIGVFACIRMSFNKCHLIDVQPTQMHSDVDSVGLSMIRNALWEAVEPTQMRSDADCVGSQ